MTYSLMTVVRLIHFVALIMGAGAATAKNVLLYRCRTDRSFVPAFLKVERTITSLIIAGQVLLTLSGTVYAYLLGYGFTPRLIVKVCLLTALWVLGPVIDNVVSPGFRNTVPAPGEPPSAEFAQALNRYLLWDVTATAIYYAIIVLWMVMPA